MNLLREPWTPATTSSMVGGPVGVAGDDDDGGGATSSEAAVVAPAVERLEGRAGATTLVGEDMVVVEEEKSG
ncbi:BQ5605_C003g02187 [Microbotryum silenes-dioicae]|uniref:BQ5605_C003g02187 protein n=1 Tax=Microbotryum silenes-dioicae TaxID=796604 RepID=A0A2X0MN23_9BASI|nr:BQ5605_C003g02187 [Microbotryum silenes-dioicae]